MVSTTILQATLALPVIRIVRHAVDQAVLSAYPALLNSIKLHPASAWTFAAKVNIMCLAQILLVRIATTPAKPAQGLQALNVLLAREACTSTH